MVGETGRWKVQNDKKHIAESNDRKLEKDLKKELLPDRCGNPWSRSRMLPEPKGSMSEVTQYICFI
jgi:hypothetical protein